MKKPPALQVPSGFRSCQKTVTITALSLHEKRMVSREGGLHANHSKENYETPDKISMFHYIFIKIFWL